MYISNYFVLILLTLTITKTKNKWSLIMIWLFTELWLPKFGLKHKFFRFLELSPVSIFILTTDFRFKKFHAVDKISIHLQRYLELSGTRIAREYTSTNENEMWGASSNKTNATASITSSPRPIWGKTLDDNRLTGGSFGLDAVNPCLQQFHL